MTAQELCNALNNRVFDLEVLEVNKTDAIVIKSNIDYKFVKKHFLDDLIVFHNGESLMTLRLQNYAIELSKGEFVITRRMFFK